MNAVAIIVAAGSGQRFGGEIPKQFRELAGKPVLDWSISAFKSDQRFSDIILVVSQAHISAAKARYPNVTVVSGGQTRAASVAAGLAVVGLPGNPLVFIHDSARPGISTTILDALFEAAEGADAAAPALPVHDALKRQSAGSLKTIERSELYRVQTPQVFRLEAIREAHAADSVDWVDDLEAVEALGTPVKLVPGHEALNKITVESDLKVMGKLLDNRGASMRIGSGYDVHAYEHGDRIILAGVEIEHDQKLSGHSDADAPWHALTDAILGALALGDIGDHFPPSDPKWKNADSRVFLEHAVGLAKEAGYHVANCDLTIICEAPKIKPHREAMRQRTADVLKIDVSQVSVKATTTEKLGFTGRGEGLAAEAVVLLSAV